DWSVPGVQTCALPIWDKDDWDAIRSTAANLLRAAGTAAGPGADAARNVAGLLTRLADADVATRKRAEAAVVPSLNYDLDRLRDKIGRASCRGRLALSV